MRRTCGCRDTQLGTVLCEQAAKLFDSGRYRLLAIHRGECPPPLVKPEKATKAVRRRLHAGRRPRIAEALAETRARVEAMLAAAKGAA